MSYSSIVQIVAEPKREWIEAIGGGKYDVKTGIMDNNVQVKIFQFKCICEHLICFEKDDEYVFKAKKSCCVNKSEEYI